MKATHSLELRHIQRASKTHACGELASCVPFRLDCVRAACSATFAGVATFEPMSQVDSSYEIVRLAQLRYLKDVDLQSRHPVSHCGVRVERIAPLRGT